MRISFDDEKDIDIQMSPLIDCVFLLLIFFLVTTMMKKWEMQIPLSLPSITSSLSTTQADQNAVVITVDQNNAVYEVRGQDAYSGEKIFVPINDLGAFLSELKSAKGVGIPIDVAAYRTVPVKSVIDVFDKCQLQGFVHTRVRLGGMPYSENNNRKR